MEVYRVVRWGVVWESHRARDGGVRGVRFGKRVAVGSGGVLFRRVVARVGAIVVVRRRRGDVVAVL